MLLHYSIISFISLKNYHSVLLLFKRSHVIAQYFVTIYLLVLRPQNMLEIPWPERKSGTSQL
jgi:hypothetical protein